MSAEPKDLLDLEDLHTEAQKSTLSINDPLEDLYFDALLHRKQRVKRTLDPADKHALDAAAKKMRDMYILPENWERSRGVALIDKGTQTLVGNFSEYRHKTFPNTRKLLREHQPIAIDATEYVEGYLGAAFEQKLRGNTWEQEHEAVCHILLDELLVEAPHVKLILKTRLGVIVRAELAADTQFASMSGQTILSLPAGTNIWEAASADTKAAMRRAVS